MRITLAAAVRGPRSHEKLERMIASVETTAARPELLDLVIGYDADDTESRRLEPRSPASSPFEVQIFHGETSGMGAMIHTLTTQFGRGPDDLVMNTTDDMLAETPGWDDRFREAVQAVRDRHEGRDAPWLYWANDCIQRAALAVLPLWSVRTLRLIGGYGSQGLIDVYNDTFSALTWGLFDPPRMTYLGDDVVLRHDYTGANPRHLAVFGRDFARMNTPEASEIATRQVRAIRSVVGDVPMRPSASIAGLTFEWQPATETVRVSKG